MHCNYYYCRFLIYKVAGFTHTYLAVYSYRIFGHVTAFKMELRLDGVKLCVLVVFYLKRLNVLHVRHTLVILQHKIL